MKTALIPLLLSDGVFSCAAGRHPAPAAPPTSGSSPELARLVDEYFDAKFQFEPSNGTSAGRLYR